MKVKFIEIGMYDDDYNVYVYDDDLGLPPQLCIEKHIFKQVPLTNICFEFNDLDRLELFYKKIGQAIERYKKERNQQGG